MAARSEMKHTGRALGALLLLASGYLVALVLGLAALVGVIVLLASGPSVATIAAVAVPVVGLLILTRLGMRARAARAALAPEGVALAQTAQPRLWADVFSVADRVGARAPDEIWVLDRVTVELHEDSRFLGLRPGPRRLVIGIPLMLGVSAEQLRALMAHELAHDSDRQSALSTHVYRGVASVRRLRAGLRTSVLDRLLLATGRAVESWAAPVVREQELGADRIAAELVGSRTAIAALKELGPLEEAWREFCDHYVLPAALVGLRPTGVFGGFVEFLDDDARQSWMEDYPERHPAGPPAAAGHPSLPDRVAALKELTTSRQLDFSGAAEDVLDRLDMVLEALEGAVTADTDLLPGPFDRVVPKATAARVAAQVSALGTAARQLEQWPLDEAALLQVVRAGRAAPLLRALAPDADGEELDRLAASLVADVAAQRLVESGRAGFVMSWSAAPALLTREGDLLDPWSVAARARVSPEGLAELELWLAEQGVRIGRRTAETPARPAADPEPTPLVLSPELASPPSPADERDAPEVEAPRPAAAAAAAAAPATAAKASSWRTARPVLGFASLASARTDDGPPVSRHPQPQSAHPDSAHPDSGTPSAAPVGVRVEAGGPPTADAPTDAVGTAEPRPSRPRSNPRELMTVLLRRVAGQEAGDGDLGAEVSAGSSGAESPVASTGLGHELALDDDLDTQDQTDEAVDEHAEPGPTQRETRKSALKELDRLRRAQDQAEREAADREAAAARAAAESEAAARRDRTPPGDARRDPAGTDDDADALDEPATASGEQTTTSAADPDSPHVETPETDEPPPLPVLNPDLAAAIAALAGAEPKPERRLTPPSGDRAGDTDAGSTGGPGAADPHADQDPTLAGPPSADEAAAAFAAVRPLAGPVTEELTGVLAAAAPISGSARGTLLVSPVGISLRRSDVTDKLRLARQRATQGAAQLTRAAGLSVHELTAHRRTETLSWADITRAEFSGLSEDRGVLTVYVGTRQAQRVEFLSTTEIHGDLLGALERLLGPRLRVS